MQLIIHRAGEEVLSLGQTNQWNWVLTNGRKVDRVMTVLLRRLQLSGLRIYKLQSLHP